MSEGFRRRSARRSQAGEGSDIIITTALIPGKPAPKLITADMVRSMKPGSVIVTWPPSRAAISPILARSWCSTASPSSAHRFAQPARKSQHALRDQPLPPRGLGAKDGASANMDDRDPRHDRREEAWSRGRHRPALRGAAKPLPARAHPTEKRHGHGAGGRWRTLTIILPRQHCSCRSAHAPPAFLGTSRCSCRVLRGLWRLERDARAATPLPSVTNAINSIIIIGAWYGSPRGQGARPRSSAGWRSPASRSRRSTIGGLR